MDFYWWSLPEALYGWMGLALQALLRQSWLCYAASVMVLLWSVVLFLRGMGSLQGMFRCLGYVLVSLIILVLFWPEVLTFGSGRGTFTAATQVASWVASEDTQAEIKTAEDTDQVWPLLRGTPALVTPGFRLLLRITTNMPLALARALNSEAHRTFSTLMPLQWLLGTDLSTNMLVDVADWVHSCYLPVLTTTLAGEEARNAEEFLPWGDTPLQAALARQSATPGSQTSASYLRNASGGAAIPCDQYLELVEFQVRAWLSDQRTPRGTPLAQAVQQELGRDVDWQARFLVYREMLKAADSAVPAPSLAGVYAALRGGSIAGKTLEEGVGAGFVAWMGKALTWTSVMTGVGKGAVQGLGSEFQRVIDALSWIVGIAVFLTWFGPYILGIALLVLIGLFVIPLLWALIPGSQFQPLALYVAALLYVSSAPLWWAIVDLAQKLAGAQVPQGSSMFLGVGTEAVQFLNSTSMTVLGLLVVPVVTGVVYFVAFRAIGGLVSRWT